MFYTAAIVQGKNLYLNLGSFLKDFVSHGFFIMNFLCLPPEKVSPER